jgi:outer membrane murein-binding lipoprotein Lpp
MNASEIISLITLGAVVLGAIVNISSMVGKAETKAASNARIETKLDNVYTEVKGMKDEQNTIKTTIQQHGERISAVEQSTKAAHHRIDEFIK